MQPIPEQTLLQIENYFHEVIRERAIEAVDVAQKGTPEHERIIQELDTTQTYTLDENFTYKRPYGFILQGQAYKGIHTWRHLYALFCKQLAAKDIKRFKDFVDSPDAKTVRGGVFFSRDKNSLRTSVEINSGICAEGNLSANAIRDRIKFLLSAFGIESREFSLYLREDRNAGE